MHSTILNTDKLGEQSEKKPRAKERYPLNDVPFVQLGYNKTVTRRFVMAD